MRLFNACAQQNISAKNRNFIFVDDIRAQFDDGANFRFQALFWRRDRRRRFALSKEIFKRPCRTSSQHQPGFA